MPVSVDRSEVVTSGVGGESETGAFISGEYWVIPLLVPVSEASAQLAEYDQSNPNHPLAAQAKPIAKAVLDALKSAVEGS